VVAGALVSPEITALLAVLVAVHLVGRVFLVVLELRVKDFWGQTHPVELQALAEAAQAAAVLVQQALQTQTLREQREGQAHHQQFLVQALPMLAVAAGVVVLLLVLVGQEVRVAVALVGEMQLAQLQALQIEVVVAEAVEWFRLALMVGQALSYLRT
jgi:hypothetical protein